MKHQLIHGDCLKVMAKMSDNSVDLVFGSPPYEDARTYGIDFKLKGQDWVDYMLTVYTESIRICIGLVAFVVQGRTKNFKWSATPALLEADLHRSGFNLRDRIIYHRIGIPGSGGPDWLRHDCEYIICVTSKGRLPWSNNTALGNLPVYQSGGDYSHRQQDGQRVDRPAKLPKIANPGNLIHCQVGGGRMGDKICHQTEAPFPEALAKFMILSFCLPDGTVLDPFCGSGTTCAVARKEGRSSIGIDIRKSQIVLSKVRLTKIK